MQNTSRLTKYATAWGVVTALAQRLRNRREGRRRTLGERLSRLARPQPLGVRERPLEPVACHRVGQVV